MGKQKNLLTSVIAAECATMQTVYLENQGDKGFVLHQLPAEAQYSPVHTVASADGKKNLLMMGNNTWTRIKFGRYSANHGMVFPGDGKGNFIYMTQPASGLNIKGNVRSLNVLNTKKWRWVYYRNK